jgi:hypothetical protein
MYLEQGMCRLFELQEMFENLSNLARILASVISTVVDQLTNNPKLEGSDPTTFTGR